MDSSLRNGPLSQETHLLIQSWPPMSFQSIASAIEQGCYLQVTVRGLASRLSDGLGLETAASELGRGNEANAGVMMWRK